MTDIEFIRMVIEDLDEIEEQGDMDISCLRDRLNSIRESLYDYIDNDLWR